jgi:hypothetical protein
MGAWQISRWQCRRGPLKPPKLLPWPPLLLALLQQLIPARALPRDKAGLVEFNATQGRLLCASSAKNVDETVLVLNWPESTLPVPNRA